MTGVFKLVEIYSGDGLEVAGCSVMTGGDTAWSVLWSVTTEVFPVGSYTQDIILKWQAFAW